MAIDSLDEAKGNILYGLHFYPGVCQYQEGNEEPYRVFLNENTLRSMDPSFAGRPVFVLHVNEIETDLDTLRQEADGWVVESFYNEADGKHWVKFLVVSEKGKQAVAQGLKLSNCYVPTSLGPGGTWNGIDYKNEITAATYEHLAIVPNPRYEESIILTPDQFKKYNEDHFEELKKLKNSKNERKSMFSFWKREKVQNSADLDSMSVLLPKSNKEVTLAKLVNDADEQEMKKDEAKMCSDNDMVEHKGEKMSVGELKAKHDKMCDDMKEMKARHYDDMKKDDDVKKDSDEGKEGEESEVMEKKNKYRRSKGGKKNKEGEDEEYKGYMDDDDDGEDDGEMNDAEEAAMSPDDEEDMAKEEHLREEEKKEVKDSKKKNAKTQADKLRNAHLDFSKYENGKENDEVQLNIHQVKRGKQLFGS